MKSSGLLRRAQNLVACRRNDVGSGESALDLNEAQPSNARDRALDVVTQPLRRA